MISIKEGAFLLTLGCGFVLVTESANRLELTLAIPLIVLTLVGFHVALVSVIAPHRLGIKKDDAYRLRLRRSRVGVPLLVVTVGIGAGFGISALLG